MSMVQASRSLQNFHRASDGEAQASCAEFQQALSWDWDGRNTWMVNRCMLVVAIYPAHLLRYASRLTLLACWRSMVTPDLRESARFATGSLVSLAGGFRNIDKPSGLPIPSELSRHVCNLSGIHQAQQKWTQQLLQLGLLLFS